MSAPAPNYPNGAPTLPRRQRENTPQTPNSSNLFDDAARQIVTAHIEEAVTNLASTIMNKAIEEVKNNAPKGFMRRLTCLKERKSSSKDSSA
jgi:hypothetical protein